MARPREKAPAMAKIPPWPVADKIPGGWSPTSQQPETRKTLYRSMRGRINSERSYIPGKTRFSTALKPMHFMNLAPSLKSPRGFHKLVCMFFVTAAIGKGSCQGRRQMGHSSAVRIARHAGESTWRPRQPVCWQEFPLGFSLTAFSQIIWGT